MLFGEVEVTRQRYRCRSCRGGFYAPNRFFDTLGERRLGEKVFEFALQLAAHVPYDQVCVLLQRLLDVRLSDSHLQREMVARGLEESARQGQVAHDQAAFRGVPEPQPPSVSRGRQYVEMDGCHVHKWHQKAGFELKVGELFTDPILTESGKRHWIEHKEYVGFAGSSAEFGERLYGCAQRWGTDEAEELYLLGDGADWIKTLWSDYFPHAQFILDWWHVQKAVWKTVRSVVRDRGERGKWAERITSALFDGQVAEALGIIGELPAQGAEEEESRDRLLGYLRRNAPGLVYYRVVQEQGIHIGSGVVENACMDTIGRRFKHRGMGWSPHGAEALLCLRILHLNGRWGDYWSQRHPKAA